MEYAEGMKFATPPVKAFFLAFGTIIGVGWITVLGSWLSNAGAYGAAIAFTAGGLVMLPITYVYGKASRALNESDGEVGFARAAFGPIAGFIASWTLLLAFIATCAFEATSASWVTLALFSPTNDAGISGSRFTSAAIGSVGALGVHLIAAKRGGLGLPTQNILTLCIILISFLFIIAGFYHGDAQNLRPHFVGQTTFEVSAGVATVLMTAPFWYAGFNVVPHASDAFTDEPSGNVESRAMSLAVVAALIFYVMIILSAAAAAPREEILSANLPAEAALGAALGKNHLANLVLLAGLLGLLTTWLALVLAASKVLANLAKDGWLGAYARKHFEIHHANGAIFIITFFSLLFGTKIIPPAVTLVGASFSFLFLLSSISYYKIRSDLPILKRSWLPDTFITWIAITVSGVLLILSIGDITTAEKSLGWELIILGGWLALGLFAIKGRANLVKGMADR